MMFSSSIYLPENGKNSFFSWLSKIPLCTSTTFSWSIHRWWDILVVSIMWLLWTVLQ
jgi:hypothetical protein